MRVAQDEFGPDDIMPLGQLVEHLDNFDEGEEIYVMPVSHLDASTPAIVTSRHFPPKDVRTELGFEFLIEIDVAKEAVYYCRGSGSRDEPSIETIIAAIHEIAH